MNWTEFLVILTAGYILGIFSLVFFIRGIRNSRIISLEKLKYYKELET